MNRSSAYLPTPSGFIPDPTLVVQNMVTRLSTALCVGAVGLVVYTSAMRELVAAMAPVLHTQAMGFVMSEAVASGDLASIMSALRQASANDDDGFAIALDGDLLGFGHHQDHSEHPAPAPITSQLTGGYL